MKKWIIGVLSIIACALCLMIFPFFITLDYYKPLISNIVYHHTGRQLTIRGHINIVIFPIPEVIIHDAALANPQGFQGADFLSVPEIDIIFKELPLFKDIVEIKEIYVINPVLTLEKMSDGSINWWLAKQKGVPVSSVQPDAEKPSHKSYNIALKKIVISNGEIHYLQNNSQTVLSDIKTTMLLSEKDGSLGIVSGFHNNGHFMNVVMNITNIQRMFNDNASTIYFSLSDISNKLALSSNIAFHDQQFDLLQMQLLVNNNQLSGAIHVNYAARPLQIKADLHGSRLNIDELRNINASSPAVNNKVLATPTSVNPTMPATQEGWSVTPIPLQFLNQIEAELYYAGPIEFPRLRIEDGKLSAFVHDGNVEMRFEKLKVEEGSANGVLNIKSINQNDKQVADIQSSLDFDHVNLAKILNNNMQGAASGKLDVKMNGDSIRDFVSSMTGNATISIVHADIKAINGNRLDTLAGGNSQTADMLKNIHDKMIFDSITASMVITNGIIANQDLQATSPSIAMTGKGEINLPEKTISYQLYPESNLITTMTHGNIKVNVSGLLSHPVITVDAQALLKKYLPLTNESLSQLKKDTKPLKDKLVKNLRHLFDSSE